MGKVNYYPMSSSPIVAYDLFGYKIIENDTIPFSEQIKNAKDAGASRVIIDFSSYRNPGDKIVILDNGDGMDEKDLLKGWLNIGTDNKKSISNALGGKGIGRFSLFRIADKITVISKKQNKSPYKLMLDKKELIKVGSIDQLKIPIEQLDYSKHFPTNEDSGTIIILENTHPIDFEKIYLELYNIIKPDIKPEDIGFEIKIVEPKGCKLPRILDVKDALKYSNFNCTAKYKGDQLISYNFVGKINDDIIFENNLTNDIKKEFYDTFKIYNNKDKDLGEIEIKLHNFYFRNEFISLNNIPKDELQNNFLNVYQGITVYRENFQIYGHGKNDWLKLAEKRVANPSKCIDNKLTFGYISLNRPNSDALEETTNREGFISGNMVYSYFKESVEFIIDLFNKDRVSTIEEMENLSFKVSKRATVMQNKDKPIDNNANEQNNSPNKDTKKSAELPSNIKETEGTSSVTISSNKEDRKENPTNNTKSKPKKPYNFNILIDSSFECPSSAPLKIKQIIYELQTLRVQDEKNLYAVALLLRCLIDISTLYARENLNLIKENENYNLKGAIDSVINYYNKEPTTRDKHLSELQKFIKKEDTIKYFNGIVHYYDYRPTYGELRTIWNKFEFYIAKCISTEPIDKN